MVASSHRFTINFRDLSTHVVNECLTCMATMVRAVTATHFTTRSTDIHPRGMNIMYVLARLIAQTYCQHGRDEIQLFPLLGPNSGNIVLRNKLHNYFTLINTHFYYVTCTHIQWKQPHVMKCGGNYANRRAINCPSSIIMHL